LVYYKDRIPAEMAKTEKPVNCITIESNMEFLFVYGTLLDPENPAGQFLHLHAEYYADGYFHGKLFDLGEYPGVVVSNNPEDKVYGSVFALEKPETVLRMLDEYEETGDRFPEPNEFIRIKIEIVTGKKEKLLCWIYLYNGSTENLLPIKTWRISG
jgi:gamma-glutamylcyclotransferase (GGCT)/AIG2-like uncharacterized protein YtfP